MSSSACTLIVIVAAVATTSFGEGLRKDVGLSGRLMSDVQRESVSVIVNEPAEHLFVTCLVSREPPPAKAPDAYSNLWAFRVPPEIDLTERGVAKYVDALAGGRLTHLFINVNYQRAYFPSKVIEPIWTCLDEPERKKPGYIREIRDAFSRGLDVYAVMVRRCRERGVSPWLSFRMNDVHGMDKPSDPNVSLFRKAHPECCLNTGGSFGSNGFDYSHKPVRDRMTAFVREALERYDVDGVELDFIRFPFYFPPGKGLASAPILTEFVRGIRSACAEAAKLRGHPVEIAARLLPSPERAREMGAAVDVWAQEGLVDMLVVCNMYDSVEYDYHLEDWRKLTGGKVPIVAGTDNGIREKDRGRRLLNAVEYRHWSDLVRQAGADGHYFFNFTLRPFRDDAWQTMLDTGKGK